MTTSQLEVTDQAVLDGVREGPATSWVIAARVLGPERAACSDSDRARVQRALQRLRRRGQVIMWWEGRGRSLWGPQGVLP